MGKLNLLKNVFPKNVIIAYSVITIIVLIIPIVLFSLGLSKETIVSLGITRIESLNKLESGYVLPYLLNQTFSMSFFLLLGLVVRVISYFALASLSSKKSDDS